MVSSNRPGTSEIKLCTKPRTGQPENASSAISASHDSDTTADAEYTTNRERGSFENRPPAPMAPMQETDAATKDNAIAEVTAKSDATTTSTTASTRTDHGFDCISLTTPKLSRRAGETRTSAGAPC